MESPFDLGELDSDLFALEELLSGPNYGAQFEWLYIQPADLSNEEAIEKTVSTILPVKADRLTRIEMNDALLEIAAAIDIEEFQAADLMRRKLLHMNSWRFARGCSRFSNHARKNEKYGIVGSGLPASIGTSAS